MRNSTVRTSLVLMMWMITLQLARNIRRFGDVWSLIVIVLGTLLCYWLGEQRWTGNGP